jgi:cytochrome c-type biogenesis protein CcmF
MMLGHLGLAVWAMGAVLVESLTVQTDARLTRGESRELGGYEFLFVKLDHYEGPNFISDRGTFEVRKNGELQTTLTAEKRQYRRGQVMTEAGLQPGIFRDLFISMGEPIDNGAAWGVRFQVKPFIRWVWAGAGLMMLGGFALALDRRYRVRAREPVVNTEGAVDLSKAEPA